MPENLTATLKWNTDKVHYLKLSKSPRSHSLSHHESLYYSSCYTKLQNEIDQAFISSFSSGSFTKLKSLKPFPVLDTEQDLYYEFRVYIVPVLIVILTVFSVFVFIKVGNVNFRV